MVCFGHVILASRQSAPFFWNTEFAVRASFLLHDSFDSSCFPLCVFLNWLRIIFFALRFHLPWVETESSSIIQECAWGFDSKCSPCEITVLQGVWALYIHGRRNESWSQSILLAIWVSLLPFLGFGILSWLKFNL